MYGWVSSRVVVASKVSAGGHPGQRVLAGILLALTLVAVSWREPGAALLHMRPVAASTTNASLTYTGDFYVLDTVAPTLAVQVNQYPADGVTFVDFTQTPVWVRLDLFNPAINSTRTYYARVSDASDWSTTGRGQASITLSSPLYDGSYLVAANLVNSSTSPVGDFSPLVADDVRVVLASAPSSGYVSSGAGYINPDSTANSGDNNGYFGFFMRPYSFYVSGSLEYVYRMNMDVGSGTFRDVDIIGSSMGISLYVPNEVSPAALHATGNLRVRYIDSVSGVEYPAFEFKWGGWTLDATDGGSGGPAGDQVAVAMRKPDLTLFHASTLPYASGSATKVQISAGDVSLP